MCIRSTFSVASNNLYLILILFVKNNNNGQREESLTRRESKLKQPLILIRGKQLRAPQNQRRAVLLPYDHSGHQENLQVLR